MVNIKCFVDTLCLKNICFNQKLSICSGAAAYRQMYIYEPGLGETKIDTNISMEMNHII